VSDARLRNKEQATSSSLPSLRRDLAANFLGKGWTGLVSFAAVPVYIHFMGIEAFGLVGVSATLAALANLLDFGLGTIVTREFARMSAHPRRAQRMKDLLATLEAVYWAVAVLLAIAILLAAQPLSRGWLTGSHLDADSVQRAVMLMGLVIGVQWPLVLYSGGMLGANAQLPLNFTQAAFATLRAGGAIFILWAISSTIQAFFIWQAIVGASQTVATGLLLRSRLSRAPGRLRPELLQQLLSFSLRMFGISVTSTVLAQVDKIVLSRLLPLGEFGYYSLAGTVASSLSYFVVPVFSAVFPQLARRLAAGDRPALRESYHASSQLMALLLVPAAAVVAAFAPQLLQAWTRNPVIAEQTAPILSVLIVGSAISGLLALPYTLQVAGGAVGVLLPISLVGALLMTCLIVPLALTLGPVGGAIAWLAVNVLSLLVIIPLVHRARLGEAAHSWYVGDILPAVLVAAPVSVVFRLFMPAGLGVAGQILWIGAALVLSMVGSALTLPRCRSALLRTLATIRWT